MIRHVKKLEINLLTYAISYLLDENLECALSDIIKAKELLEGELKRN